MRDDYKIDHWKLRNAILRAFGGRCFYTGQVVTKDNMAIDHVVPKSKGGEDSVYNYVLTTRHINSRKSNMIDKEGVAPILYLIKTVYAPKVFKLLNSDLVINENMIRTTIYIGAETYANIKESAWQERLSIGKYITKLYNKVNKPQVPEKVPEAEKVGKADSPSATGAKTKESMDFIDEASSISEEVYEKIKPPEDRKEVVNKIQTTLKSFSKNSQLGKKEK